MRSPSPAALVLMLMVGFASSALTIAVERKFFPRPTIVATVGLRSMIDDFVSRTAKSEADKDEVGKRAAEYARRLSAAADALGRHYGVIVMPAEAVLAGGVDLTDELSRLVSGAPQ